MSRLETDDPLFSDVTVKLALPISDSTTPQDAVKGFKQAVLDYGLDTFVYQVIDEDTNTSVWVHGANVYSEQEAIAAFGFDNEDDDVDLERLEGEIDDDDPDG